MAGDDTPRSAAAPAEPHAPAQPVRTGLALCVPLFGVALLLLVLVGALAGGLRWMLATEPGTAWLLQQLGGSVQAQGWRGALLGSSWQAERLRVQWDGGRQSLLIEDLKAEGLQWQWRPQPHAWVGLRVGSLAARRLTLDTGPKAADRPAPTLPAALQQPLDLQIDRLALQAFVLGSTTAPAPQPEAPPLLQDLLATGLHFRPAPGAQHAIDSLQLQSHGVALQGRASLANAQPYALQAQATARPVFGEDSPAWAAVAQAEGPLENLALRATLRGRAPPRGEAPALDLRAQLQPLKTWPLAGLDLRTEALDLSALTPQAPATRLSGSATLQGGAAGQPLQARVNLDNALPGRWNEGRLPLRQLQLEAAGSLQQPERVALPRFELLLADASGSAGRYSGSAVWQGRTLTLESQLQNLAPQRLDGRAAAMTLTGPLALTLRGLPSPDPRSTAPTGDTATGPSLDWKLDLQGRLDGAPQAVQLQLEGSADDQRLVLRRATAQAGRAEASLTATLQRLPAGDWQLATSGSVTDFDPVPWWPGEADGAWRQGPHRLSGGWQFDVRLPRKAETLKPLALAQRLAGNGALRLRESMLAGVALSADLSLGYTQAAAPTPAALRAELQLGGNTLRLDARGDPLGAGTSDRWSAEVDAPSLGTWAPLARLVPALAAWAPTGGSVTAQAAAEGRWPSMRTTGNASLQKLQLGALSVARGAASWQLASEGTQALSLQAELADIRQGTQRADLVRARLSGTLADHQLQVTGAVPLMPPRWAEQMLALAQRKGTQAQLQGSGQWAPAAEGGGTWRGRLEKLTLGAWDGVVSDGAATASAAAPGPWLDTSNLRAELGFAPGGSLVTVMLSPGRVRLGDSVALRWDEVRADLRGEQPQVQLSADIEPFTLAPLLARLQPTMGWQGDLKLGARVNIRAAEKMDADLVFERSEGDLHLAGGEGTQLLGLTDFRVSLSAHQGQWQLVPVFKGRSLGELSGRITAQTTPQARWPGREAALGGELRARVADVGIWGAWVPPGWRLAGQIDTTAKLGGTVGQPTYDGELTAQGLAVRNLLAGVNVSDGQVRVKLAGDTATVERFTLKAGDGTATITGNATLGSSFKVLRSNLKLKAERLRVLGRVDRQLIASGEAAATLEGERIQLDGKFRVDEGLFDLSRGDAPSLDDDVTVRRADAPEETRATAEDTRAQRNFTLGLDIDVGDKVRVRGYGVDLGLRGQVRVTNPGGRLAVNGTISSEGGTYQAYGQKLEIERGIVAFSGPYNNPRLDVLALRPNIDQRVGVAITGNALTPRVRLYAEPELSDSEKLSWLVLGRAPDGLGRNDTALLQRAAVALLSGEGEAPTDALMRNLGIDEVSLRQGDGDVRETVITVGKQLSRRWYLGYERGVNATTGTWQLIYRIAQRFTLRAQSGEESALDIIWTWRMQETPADAGMRKSTVTPP